MRVYNTYRQIWENLDAATTSYLRNGGTIHIGLPGDMIQDCRLVGSELVLYGDPYKIVKRDLPKVQRLIFGKHLLLICTIHVRLDQQMITQKQRILT
jgi:hypothetical protein